MDPEEIKKRLPTIFNHLSVVTLDENNGGIYHELVRSKIINPLLTSVLKDKFYGPRLKAMGYVKPEDFDLQCLLGKHKVQNASNLKLENPGYIIFNEGLLSLINLSGKPKTDQVAYVYGHELAHYIMRLVLGHGENSKGEEGNCDSLSMQWMQDAGFSAQGAEDFILTMYTANVMEYDGINLGRMDAHHTIFKEITLITDVHTNLPNRLEAARKFKATNRRAITGEVQSSSNDIADELTAVAATVEFHSYVKKFAERVKWKSLNIDEKVAVLTAEIATITKYNADYNFSALNGLISAVASDPNCLRQHREALAESLFGAAHFCNTTHSNKVLYEGLIELNSTREISRITQMLKSANAFVNAKTEEEIIRNGRDIVEQNKILLTDESAAGAGIGVVEFDKYKQITSFEVKNVGLPPWEKHFQVAKKLALAGDYTLVRALWTVGVPDPRLFHISDMETLRAYKLTKCIAEVDSKFLALADNGEVYDVVEMDQDEMGYGIHNNYINPANMERQYYKVVARIQTAGKINAAVEKFPSGGFLSVVDVPPVDLMNYWEYFFDTFEENELKNPLRTIEQPDDDVNAPKDYLYELADEHIVVAKAVVAKLSWLIDAKQNPDYAKHPQKYDDFVRGLFLGRDDARDLITALGIGTIGKKSDFTNGGHPYLNMFAKCSNIFTFEERYRVIKPIINNINISVLRNSLLGMNYDLAAKLEELNKYNINSPRVRLLGSELVNTYLRENKQADPIQLLLSYRQFFIGFKDAPEKEVYFIKRRIEEARLPKDVESKIVLYRTLERARIIPNDKYKEKLKKAIKNGINELNDHGRKTRCCEMLLFSLDTSKTSLREISDDFDDAERDTYDQRSEATSRRKSETSEHIQNTNEAQILKDYQLRKFAIDKWIAEYRSELGRDDNSEAYKTRTLKAVESICERVTPVSSPGIRLKLFSGLAKQITAQKAVAYALRDGVGSPSRDSMREIGEYLKIGELSLSRLTRNPQARMAVIEFLTSPLSDESLEKFYHHADPLGTRVFAKAKKAKREFRETYKELMRDLESHGTTLGSGLYNYEDGLQVLMDELAKLDDGLVKGVGVDFETARKPNFETLDYNVLRADEEDSISSINRLPPKTQKLLFAGIKDLDKKGVDYLTFYAHARANAVKCIEQLPNVIDKVAIAESFDRYEERLGSCSNADFEKIKAEVLRDLKAFGDNKIISRVCRALDDKKTQRGAKGVITANKAEIVQALFDAKLKSCTVILNGKISIIDDLVREIDAIQKTEKFIAAGKQGITLEKFLQNAVADYDQLRHTLTVDQSFDLEQDWNKLLDKAYRRVRRIETFYDHLLLLLAKKGQGLSLEARIVEIDQHDMEKDIFDPSVEDPSTFEQATIEKYLLINKDRLLNYHKKAAELIRQQQVITSPSASEIVDALTLHENFRFASITERAFILDELLITPEQKADDSINHNAENFNEALEYVVARFLPEQDEEALRFKHSLRIYIDVAPIDEKPIILSIIATVMQTVDEEAPDVSLGEKLAMLAELMGPFEVKVGQAASYNPDVLASIREGVGKKLKNRAAESLWWDLIERYEDIPEEAREQIQCITGVAGEASIQQNLFARRFDGTERVIGMQRENVLPRAEYGAKQMAAYARKLLESGQFEGMGLVFVDLIEHARANLVVETNHILALKQLQIAIPQAEKTSIQHNGYTSYFHAASWDSCGPNFRDMQAMEGIFFSNIPDSVEDKKRLLADEDVTDREKVHIARLPDNDQELMAIKKAASLSYIGFMMTNICSGEEVDYDRHDKQTLFMIDPVTHEIHCNQFDHGCMALEKPDSLEKEQLGRALVHMAISLSQGKTIHDSVMGIISQTKEELVDLNFTMMAAGSRPINIRPDYLIRIEKALNTLRGDFAGTIAEPQKYFSQDEALSVLSAIFKNKFADKEIFEAARKELLLQIDSLPVLQMLSAHKNMVKTMPQNILAEFLEGNFPNAGPVEISRSRVVAKEKVECKVFDENGSRQSSNFPSQETSKVSDNFPGRGQKTPTRRVTPSSPSNSFSLV